MGSEMNFCGIFRTEIELTCSGETLECLQDEINSLVKNLAKQATQKREGMPSRKFVRSAVDIFFIGVGVSGF